LESIQGKLNADRLICRGRRTEMAKFILGLILGIILVPVAVILYLISGYAPAAASDPPMPFEKTIARAALGAKISKEMPATVAIPVNEANLMEGANQYRMNCAMCHGLPKQPAPIIAKGMFPTAPQLFKEGGGVADDPAGETYWKAKNGIRLTGMPGFKGSLTEVQLWQVSILLANADKLPASVQQALAGAPAPLTQPTEPAKSTQSK
jgi:thiosulfate dehydrogenase